MSRFSLEELLKRQNEVEELDESILCAIEDVKKRSGRGLKPGQTPPCQSGADAQGCIPRSDRKYQIQHLWERHHQIKRLALMGLSHKEIADHVGVTPVTVSNVLNSDIMKNELAKMRSDLDDATIDIMSHIYRGAATGVLLLNDVLEDPEAPISLKAKVAQDMLSRAGFSPVVKGQIEHRHLTDEDIEQLKLEARSAAARDGALVVEGEFTAIN